MYQSGVWVVATIEIEQAGEVGCAVAVDAFKLCGDVPDRTGEHRKVETSNL